MDPLGFFFPFFASTFCQPLAIRVAPAVCSCYVAVVEKREREQDREQRRGSGQICRASGRIARILERQGDGRRGNTSRRGSRPRSREGRETAETSSKRSRDLVFSELGEPTRTLQSVSARSIFRNRLGRTRFVARRPRRLRPR